MLRLIFKWFYHFKKNQAIKQVLCGKYFICFHHVDRNLDIYFLSTSVYPSIIALNRQIDITTQSNLLWH